MTGNPLWAAGRASLLVCHGEVQAIFGRDEVIEIYASLPRSISTQFTSPLNFLSAG